MIDFAIEPGAASAALDTVFSQLDHLHFAEGLLARRLDVWTTERVVQQVIANRLGWLGAIEFITAHLARIEAFAKRVRGSGLTDVVLFGMGGSSLAPEVFHRVLGRADELPRFRMLDSTDPVAVHDALAHAETSLFVIASKSGTTVEPSSMAALARRRVEAALGDGWASRFVAITDEGTDLHRRAVSERFLEIFVNPSDIGGRYSALTFFGMVPAALMGIPLAAVVERTRAMVNACHSTDPRTNPGVALGALMGAAAASGRDKLTLLVPDRLESFGLWVEQLVAESTGKQGKGIVPIASETAKAPAGDDRMAVVVRIDGDGPDEQAVDRMRAAGAPLMTINMPDIQALGAEFFRWEIATATAGRILEINPFDEPNVKQAKDATKTLLQTYATRGELPMKEADSSRDGIRFTLSRAARTRLGANGVDRFLSVLAPRDYFALLAYLPPDDPVFDPLLRELRNRVAVESRCATMFSYGPRYLHSTGQLHKGGPTTGVFIIVTAPAEADLPIPGAAYSFGVLETAQALGDFQSLDDAGRRVLHAHLPDRHANTLQRLADIVNGPLRNHPSELPGPPELQSRRRVDTRYTPPVKTIAVQSLLARTQAALERGRGAEAAQLIGPILRSGSLTREDELAVRSALAEAWLLQDDLAQAAATLGRPPDALHEPISDARRSTLWRLHGRITYARGEQSRAIALHSRALKHAELAHDSRAIGLAHYELALCYKQVGDSGIVREHLTEAASALHAGGDRRHLALVHSLSAILLAQSGRGEEAGAALRQAERLATAVQADDVLAGIVHNQANVALMRHQHDQALVLAERSVALHETLASGHGLAVALATLGQIFVQLGDLERAEQILTRTLEVRSPIQFHETTGAVFDTLAQIHLMRGSYERADEYLRHASEAYGAYGTQTMRWYEWSLKVLGVRLAIRRGGYDEAIAIADELAKTPGVPSAELIQADLAACEALVAANRIAEAAQRIDSCESRLDARTAPANWGEFLRIRGTIHERSERFSPAYHDFAQSVNVFELLGERYQSALSQLALGRLGARTGPRDAAERHLDLAASVFRALGARRHLDEVEEARSLLSQTRLDDAIISSADTDDAMVRRLIDASVLSDLLARETVTALLEATEADAAVVFVVPSAGEVRVVAMAGCDAAVARALARAAAQGNSAYGEGLLLAEPLGRDHDGPRHCTVVAAQRLTESAMRRFRLFGAVARQGFELCGARDRRGQPVEQSNKRPLEPLLPGFICASAAMNRVADQIQRVQGHDLTVLITGESGTGKDLVARAIHVGSPRNAAMFLPYNCTTTQRDLANSQLFGHRRGSFTGAITDQQGLIRTAAGGTLFLDEIGDLPLDIQPKLLRFLEQGEVMPVGDTRPQGVDVRVLAATNADLEQRVQEGRFREDLYYRLAVIRIYVPPLRERREEIPHLSTYFLREASERLRKPDVHLSSVTLDLFDRYWWPGNVRQLRNEVQRAVAMSPPGGTIEPDQLSPDLSAPPPSAIGTESTVGSGRSSTPRNLAAAVEEVERDIIGATLHRTRGNISETARVLGLTRRGLYMKMRRLGLDGVAADTE